MLSVQGNRVLKSETDRPQRGADKTHNSLLETIKDMSAHQTEEIQWARYIVSDFSFAGYIRYDRALQGGRTRRARHPRFEEQLRGRRVFRKSDRWVWGLSSVAAVVAVELPGADIWRADISRAKCIH